MKLLIVLILVLVFAITFMVYNIFEVLKEQSSIDINLEELEYPWEKTESQLPIYKEYFGKG